MSKSLTQQWFGFFENLVLSELNMKVQEIEDYQRDIAPLVYCCLHHKRVPIKPRTVIIAKTLENDTRLENKDWKKLRDLIENGKDINSHMSKGIKDWKSIDYLLYTSSIRHLHLNKNKDGGIQRELVFGIFTDEAFYTLLVSDHKDLYDIEALINIAEVNWPNKLFRYSTGHSVANNFSSGEFKIYANESRLQFNLFSPNAGTREDGTPYAINNHQNTELIACEINGKNYGKLPLRAWQAYCNELKRIEEIEAHLIEAHGTDKLNLSVDIRHKKYAITIQRQRQIHKSFSFPKDKIICSTYSQHC